MKILGTLVVGISLASPAFAQSPARSPDARQVHYQIDMMERVLEAAVAHGAAGFRDRLQAVAPDAPVELLIIDSPRVRGFKLDPYGVFFDVSVPSLNGTLTWSLKVLDQGDPGVQNALNTLRTRIDPSDTELRQAVDRIAVRVSAASPTTTATPVAASDAKRPATPTLPNTRRPGAGTPDRQVTSASVAPTAKAVEAETPDNILDNPNEVYRSEVVKALSEAMLDYSGALPVNDGEWVEIGARGAYDRALSGPTGNDGPTIMIRVRGADLAAFRAGQISRDEVMKRIERRVF
jgi:hypothetical protein